MNLWTFISTLILSLGLSSPTFYHLPVIVFGQNDGKTTASFREYILDDNNRLIPHKIDNKSLGVKISAQSAAVMDIKTGIVLWQKNANEVRSIASISKLMTALVFLEHNPGWQTEMTMEHADETNGGTARILRGETVSVKDLFYTSLIASDNNATTALVRSTGLSKEEFVALMNQKAADLQLKHTSFVEPTGLEDGNQSTVLDILLMAKQAFNNPDIKAAVNNKNYTFSTLSGREHKIQSTNLLLNSYMNIIAGKTGYINAAGYCLVSEVAGENGQVILSVVLGSDSHESRFQDLKILSAWVLDNFVWS